MQRVWSTYLEEAFSHRRGGSGTGDPASRRNSSGSQATSTRHIINNSTDSGLPGGYANQPPLSSPNVPFSAASATSLAPPSSATGYHALTRTESNSNLSLAANYIPSKFSSAVVMGGVGPRGTKRKNGKGMRNMPKIGGGTDAFRSGERRIGGDGDDDYDGVDDPRGLLKGGRKLRWTRFKWVLFSANVMLTIYSLVALIFCILTWFNVWAHADIVRVANTPELILSTIASSIGVLTCCIGWAGILLNNRAFLAVYSLLAWITFAFLVVPGYVTYKRYAFSLEAKLNQEWSRNLGTSGRARIQNELNCCGYFSPFIEATISSTCYARSILPGCKLNFLKFERVVLKRWYIVAFSLVPPQMFVMVSALLCSNHVTYRFGKGMMPKAYQLTVGDMAVIMDTYAAQLADQYVHTPDASTDYLLASGGPPLSSKSPLGGSTSTISSSTNLLASNNAHNNVHSHSPLASGGYSGYDDDNRI